MKSVAIIAAVLIGTGSAHASQCQYDQRVESNYNVKIDKVVNYRSSVQRYVDDTSKCVVSFDAKVGWKTISVRGDYIYGPDMSRNDACYQAELKAKHQLVRAVAQEEISSKVNMKCLSNTAEVKDASFLKKTGKVSFRIFEMVMCGQKDCLK